METHREGCHKKVFVIHQRLFEFIRMPFVLWSAPATFQRAIDIILSTRKWIFCMVYLDDIIIISYNIDDHLKHILKVLTPLRQAVMTLRVNKCFMQKGIEYLGHIVEPHELHVANKVIDTVQEMEPPYTKTQLRSFPGICKVYRKFVKDFATIPAPLNKPIKKTASDSIETFTKDQQQSFKTLKQKLASPSILSLPCADLPYILDTDPNSKQIGCVLAQRHGLKY